MVFCHRARVAVGLLAGVFAVAGVASVHRYEVRVDPSLRAVHVRAELSDAVAVLRARNGDAARLDRLVTCGDRPLSARGNRILLGGEAQCLSYQYPFGGTGRGAEPPVRSGVVITEPSRWLWVPELDHGDRLHIELSLPTAVNASVPWRPLGGHRYELRASPESSAGHAVFGSFQRHLLALPGAEMEVALVDGPRAGLDVAKMLAWLDAAARDVAGVYGRFPNPAPQVIVQPSTRTSGWGGGSAVPFGYVIRDGGEAVRFFVKPDRPLDEYLSDWTATHEFSHLLLPYVRSRDKWISEGFASYYQNVLLARRGVYSEQDAWRRLHRSFRKAAATDDPPRLQDVTERPFWEMRMLIYWSGAALALLADAQLRAATDGEESLDSVLGRLQACCLPSERTWRAEELFKKLDELSPVPLFVGLYERYASSRGMPDLAPLYQRLGIDAKGNGVVLNDRAPWAAVRRAIMSGST